VEKGIVSTGGGGERDRENASLDQNSNGSRSSPATLGKLEYAAVQPNMAVSRFMSVLKGIFGTALYGYSYTTSKLTTVTTSYKRSGNITDPQRRMSNLWCHYECNRAINTVIGDEVSCRLDRRSLFQDEDLNNLQHDSQERAFYHHVNHLRVSELDQICTYHKGKLVPLHELEEATGAGEDLRGVGVQMDETPGSTQAVQTQVEQQSGSQAVEVLTVLEEKLMLVSEAADYCRQLNESYYQCAKSACDEERQNPPSLYRCSGYMYQADKKNPLDLRFYRPMKVSILFFSSQGRSTNELTSQEHGYGILPSTEWHTFILDDAHSTLENFAKTMEQQYSTKDDERYEPPKQDSFSPKQFIS
jgi:hypothetical protein